MRQFWTANRLRPPVSARTAFGGALPSLPAAWQCDLSDASLRWTEGVYQLFGLPTGTRLDRRAIVAMYCEESRDLLERLRSLAITERGSFTFEARIRRPTGEFRWMRVTADTLCANGRTTHLYGMKQDITNEMAVLAAS